MYKTVWLINHEEYKTELTYYHFGKDPKFPPWYMQKGVIYEIEMKWNLKLCRTLNTFLKCLFRERVLR